MRIKKTFSLIVLIVITIILTGCKTSVKYNISESVVYNDTVDGIVDYHKLGIFKKVLYDNKTNKLMVLRNDCIDIYNANTMTFESKLTSILEPACADVDGGKLVVGYMSNYFKIFDLAKNFDNTTVFTEINVSEIVIDGNMVIYADDNQWCDVVFHNILTNEKMYHNSVFQPLLTINRKDHILYLTETNITSSELMYFNSQDGSILYESQFSQFKYVNNRILFNGKYIHHEGKSFNRYTGSVVSQDYLNRSYPNFTGFTPESVLYDSESVAFVSSNNIQNRVAVYNNVENNFVYNFPLAKGSIIYMKDGKYLAVCGNNEYVAVVDVKLIDEGLVNDGIDDVQVGNIIISLDGKLKTLGSQLYNKSLVDGNYIYTLDESNYELNVYDVITLKKVYSEKFLIKPVSIDADSTKLLIGFGDAKQFRVYNTVTWDYETVNTTEPVFSCVLYKDRVIYAQIYQYCTIFDYNMTSKTHSNLGYIGYFVSMAINREKGIIYFGDCGNSGSNLTYYNLETNEVVSSIEFNYSYTIVRFDGNFIHYYNATFDETTGLKVSNTSQAREYKNINNMTNINTIFDDESISVFIGIENGEYITVVYDLMINTHLYTCKGKGTNAYRNANTIIVLDNIGETIRTININ